MRFIASKIGLCWLMCVFGIVGLSSIGYSQAKTDGISQEKVQNLLDTLDDIDKLNVLIPLDLTSAQCTKMAEAIQDEQNAYDRKLKLLSKKSLGDLEKEIVERKKRALEGEQLPKPFIVTILAFSKKRAGFTTEMLATLSPKLQKILTVKQIAAAAKLAREYPKTDGSESKGTDIQWFNFYVLNVVMTYPRMAPLLKELAASKAMGN